MKAYLKVADLRLKEEEKKVEEQKEVVVEAQENLERAQEELKRKRQEVDKLVTHKKDWLKEVQREIEHEEQKEMDEIGQVLYSMHQRKKKKNRRQ